ncbi:MAG: dockerin type I domain-containing protein [Clostridiales bacterium]|nr:dockerin type I domain-containing protein [Clostridiales bacterium]
MQIKHRLKKTTSLLLAVTMAAWLLAGMSLAVFAEDDDGYSIDDVLGGRILKPFTLAGSFEGGAINGYTVNANNSAYLWNSATDKFEPVETSASVVVGNFVQLRDVTRDGRVDGILVVSWKDSGDYWDSGMHWNDDFDDDGAFSDGQEWRIPFGERLLEEYGVDGAVVDYGNILDYADLENSTYWPQHDYYNATSSDTLTMLTGFATTQQATGWACGPTSAVMVMDWFGLRGDLNEEDLAALRQKSSQGGATNLQQMVNIFEGLNELDAKGIGEWGKWEILSSYDIVKDYGIAKPVGGKYNLMSVGELMDGTLIKELLSAGIPILIGWNSFGGHWQVIIGYDDMGSDDTKDHVLILADPYDTTDHRNDGYNIQSLERFVYDWSAGFDTDFRHGIFVAAVPEGWEYEPVYGDGIAEYRDGYDGDDGDDMKLSYGRTAVDIQKYYPTTPYRGDNGLAGAATGGYERVPNDFVNVSPYYAHFDYYNMESSDNLVILENFKTQQQTTEWTCGLTSALMALEWHGANPGLAKLLNGYSEEELVAVADAYGIDVYELLDDRMTEINLAQLRGDGRQNPSATNLDDMKSIFNNLNNDEEYLNAVALANNWDTLKKWSFLTTDDLTRGYVVDEAGVRHFLEEGAADDGLIPYYLNQGCPILIGWNEWGGHWQVIIGYDDMGTEDTQDDVLILADPYDTTDHNQDGYYLEPFERLVFGWGADFDRRGSNVFLIPWLIETGIPIDENAKSSDAVKIASVLNANLSAAPVSGIEGDVEFTLSVSHAKDLLALELEFTIDAGMLSGKGTETLNGFVAVDGIAWRSLGANTWRGTLTVGYPAGDDETGYTSYVPVDVAKFIFAPRAVGETAMKLTGVKAVGLDGETVFLDAIIVNGEAVTVIEQLVWSKYDLNKDNKVDALDLGIMLLYCGFDSDSPNWDTLVKVNDSRGRPVTASMCDVNSDGLIDMLDLIDLFIHYTK